MPSKKRNIFVPLDQSSQSSQEVANFVIPKKGNHAIRIKSTNDNLVVHNNPPLLDQAGNATNESRWVNRKIENPPTTSIKIDKKLQKLEAIQFGTLVAVSEVASDQHEPSIDSRPVQAEHLTTTHHNDSVTHSSNVEETLRVSGNSKKLINTAENLNVQHQAISIKQNTSNTPFRSKLNIYARKHVPLWLKLVNESYAVEIQAPPLKRIDYDVYRATFAGTSTLSPPPLGDPAEPEPCKITHEVLDSSFYQDYWHQRLQNEYAAQDIQLSGYALHNVDVLPDDPRLHLYRFTIPGLRENAPRVDLGDVILIRPLAPIIQNTIAAQANWWSQTRDGIAPGFTGQQHNAIVWSIMRRDEVVLVKLGSSLPRDVRCNIIIPLQKHKCAPMWRAPNVIHNCLSADVTIPEKTWLESILFPQQEDGVIQASLSKGVFGLRWVDSELNFEQKRAVQAVIDANYGNVPYLISGPPGTGKSKTIVETALQLLCKSTEISPHLLICAPSDAAADTLLVGLSESLTPKDLFRLNNWTRLVSEVPGEVRPYCYVDSNTLHSLPTFENMMDLKIVVTTCRDANMLITAGLTNSALTDMATRLMDAIAPGSRRPSNLIHWTALLLDEAAQATEPEALVPLSVVIPSNSQLVQGICVMPQFVLAGDEHQLGPLLASKHLVPFEIPIITEGLEISLFQRLFSRDLYTLHPLSRTNGAPPLTASMLPIIRPPFTNLIRNYRSHPAILTTSSYLFYSDTLIPERPDVSEAILSWPLWPSLQKNTVAWPVLFHHNTSPDSVESVTAGDGTGAGSLENHGEAETALNLVQSLIDHDKNYCASFRTWNASLLRQEDFIVMSPFNAQVRNLRKVFRNASLYDVRIGPLEAFQGLESRVVVLCTTRTRLGQSPHATSKFVTEDKARGLGVIDEPKRFNVALTRAKEALIVIGNAEALTCTLDRCWVSFLEFCERNALFSVETPFGLRRGLHRSGKRSGVGKLEKALKYTAGLMERAEEEDYNRQVTGSRDERHSANRFRLQGQMHDLDEMMRTVDYRQFEEEEQLFEEEDEDE